MKIYIGHSREFDFEEELYKPIRESQLNSEHEIILPHEEGKSFVTRDIIKTSEVMIAEVSYPSTGLGIELGWANSLDCPIICIYQKNKTISGSLKAVCDNFIEYTDKNDMIEKIGKTLLTVRD